jgi:hypothetical protein
MNKFTRPAKFNWKQLQDELKAAGIAYDQNGAPEIDGDGNFYLPIAAKDVTKAEKVVKSHVGIDVAAEEAKAKAVLLERLGITDEEAKLLLA